MVASTIVPVVMRIPLLQIQVHCVQHLATQFMLYQQMTEVENGRLIRNWSAAQIDARETAQHRRLVKRIFHARVGKREPLLQKVNPKHDVQSHRLAARLALRIVRLN
jgi:hypothetical protein